MRERHGVGLFLGFARLGRGLNGVGLVGLAGLLNFEGVC